MKLSPVRIVLILLFVFIGCFGVAYAAAGMLTALPAPAIGGTCGPSTGSETATEALARPGSIGAGPRPPASNPTAAHQWETFVQQCQALADRRGLASLAVLVISLAVAAVGLIWVIRRAKQDAAEDGETEPTSPAYAPLGLGDPGILVGAGVGAGAPGAAVAPGGWYPYPPPPPPGYGPPTGYAMPQPGYGPPPGYAPAYPPAYPPAGYAEGAAAPQQWPVAPVSPPDSFTPPPPMPPAASAPAVAPPPPPLAPEPPSDPPSLDGDRPTI